MNSAIDALLAKSAVIKQGKERYRNTSLYWQKSRPNFIDNPIWLAQEFCSPSTIIRVWRIIIAHPNFIIRNTHYIIYASFSLKAFIEDLGNDIQILWFVYT